MSKTTFTIVTTTFNRVKSGYLAENIESLQQQIPGGFSYEHIIVDDGSTDGTKEYVTKIAKKDKRIKYLYQENAGPAKATQYGISKAVGDFIIIVDDDDKLTPDSLALRYKHIRNNPSADWFYGKAEWIDDFGLPTEPLFQSKFYKDHLYERLLITNTIHAGTPTTRASALKKIEWPSWLNRSQDYFLWLELARPELGLNVGFIDELLLIYRYHSQSYTATIDSINKNKAKEELNFQIKALHPEQLAFLAKEAYTWLEEAHKTNNYWRDRFDYRVGELEIKATHLENEINSYHSSRMIRPVIRLRNNRHRIQSFASNIPKRLVHKAIDTILPNTSNINYELVQKEKIQNGKPLVSVITPFFNRQDTMPETIRSVLNQSYQDFEYIVVDDGSTSNASRQYLDRLSHSKLHVIHQKNQGVAVARNTGIAHANGKYIICLDSDDIIDPTYIEKAVTVAESDPDISLVTFDTKMFGVRNDYYFYHEYDPLRLVDENLILTAALFKREAWEKSGGYKQKIGYEDWEFWINITKHGFFGKHVPEPIFNYRTANNSRYVDDMDNHKNHTSFIRKLHPDYVRLVSKMQSKRKLYKRAYSPDKAFINLSSQDKFIKPTEGKKNILTAVPWMTFGGAETLIYNFCSEIKADFNISFVTGIKDAHEWEYKFKEISQRIYHLPNMFDDQRLYLEFMSNYIKTRSIDVLHIIHTSYVFDMLPELKRRHPHLKVAVTIFNDRAHFNESLAASSSIDLITTDNKKVAKGYSRKLKEQNITVPIQIIPNGVNTQLNFNPTRFNREVERSELGITKDDLAVFFIGRLSEEKNPDVFITAAKQILDDNRLANYKFFIIGDGKMRTDIESEINTYNSSRIKYLGYQTDIAKYLSTADVFVLPSSVEGFPLSILEAMAMDVAVVASKVGAVSDVIDTGKDGFVVTPGSAIEISNIIRQLKENRQLLTRVKNSGRMKVEAKYSNVTLGDNYRNLYNSL